MSEAVLDTTPGLKEVLSSTRTEAEYRASIERAVRNALPATFYTILVRWPREVRLFTIETELLETKEQVQDAIAQLSRGCSLARVIRHDDDSAPRDVTEEFYREEGDPEYRPKPAPDEVQHVFIDGMM